MRAIKVEDEMGNKVIIAVDNVVQIYGQDDEGLTRLILRHDRYIDVVDPYEDILRRLDWEIVE